MQQCFYEKDEAVPLFKNDGGSPDIICFKISIKYKSQVMSFLTFPLTVCISINPRNFITVTVHQKCFFFHKKKNSQGLAAYKSNVCCSKILLTFISRSGSSINTAESYEGQAALSFSGLLILGLAAALSLVLFSASNGAFTICVIVVT